MENLIVVPNDIRERHINPWMEFLDLFSLQYGFRVVFADRIDWPADLKRLIIYGVPQHNRPFLLSRDIKNLPPEVKIVGWLQDLQTYGLELVQNEQVELLDRYDRIITYRKHDFLKRFPQHEGKHAWIPNWLYNEGMYATVGLNEHPIPQFTLSGNAIREAYPLRHYIASINHPDIIRFGTFTYNAAEYVKVNNMYMGGITCTSKWKTVLKKHFEIPAAGGLLLSDQSDEMYELGFRHMDNFVDYTQFPSDVGNVVNHILYTSGDKKWLTIRENGMNFVRSNHSVSKRYSQWKAVVMEALGMRSE